MFNLGTPELLLILSIVLLIFGAKRIPEIFSGLGKGMRSFKKAISGDENQSKENEDVSNQGTPKV